jgi:two-component system, NtrC family, sensor kinase
VASPWRIRHKLLLGLASVVGILALLLLGTLEGLGAYRSTMNTVESKLLELRAAQELHLAVTGLASPFEPFTTPKDELRQLDDRIKLAKDAFAGYRKALADTVERGRDPEGGFNENQLTDALNVGFLNLDRSLDEFKKPSLDVSSPPPPLRMDPNVIGPIHELLKVSKDLQDMLYHDQFDYISRGKSHFKITMWIVGSMGVVFLVLVAGLSRFYYTWVFYPIRDLEEGVGRLAQGDFNNRIDLHSGDEMEDLAAAFNDMTDRLHEMYRDLERQVNERSRQLVRSERLASVGFLAAGVAHEINNPLHAIALCSEALEGRLGELVTKLAATQARNMADCEVIYKHLKTIQDEAFRCKAITERLLEFSRGGERKREPIPLDELLQSALQAAQHLPNCRGKRLRFEPSGSVVASVNALEIKSVALNLVVNALDSMDEGGTLTVRLRQWNGQAEIVFSDTGCGMEAEVLENIFEPFYTRSRSGKGTGLGLTITHRIVTQHGGEIEAASAGPGKGSTFTVRLPLQPAGEGAGVRNQESGVRTQGSTHSSQESESRNQRSEAQEDARNPDRARSGLGWETRERTAA